MSSPSSWVIDFLLHVVYRRWRVWNRCGAVWTLLSQ